MAVNLSSLADKTTAAIALGNLVLVTPSQTLGYQPQNPRVNGVEQTNYQRPPTLLFHYEGEQTVSIESDITDHYTEANIAIQDQIALRPEIITTRGFIGELNDVVPELLKPLKTAAEKLTAIGAYEPQLSVTAQEAYAKAFFAYQIAVNTANAAVSGISSLASTVFGTTQAVIGSTGIETQQSSFLVNKQQSMFQQFYGYWRSRTLFNVQTPWAVFQNMAIKSLRAIQDEETRVITSFEVQFKMIRFATTATTLGGLGKILQGRSISQASSLTDLGTSSGQGGESLLTSVGRMFA